MKRLLFAGFLLFSANSLLAQDVPKQINGGILNGKAISLPKPVYPEQAKADKLEGIVRIEVVIDESGDVIAAEPATGLVDTYRPGGSGMPEKEPANAADPMLIEAGLEAAKKAKFSPTLLNGIGVKVKGTVVYRFVAADNDAPTDALGGGILNGKAISLPNPVYPPAARAVKAEGTVTVKVLIDEGGSVISAEAVSGHPLLRAASVAAAREAQFAPTTINGGAVKVSGVLTYNFVP
jgi:TonB family protein